MCVYVCVCVSLADQTLITGAKESCESHAKVMFHWNALRNFTQNNWYEKITLTKCLCCCCSNGVNSPRQRVLHNSYLKHVIPLLKQWREYV